MTTYIFQTPEHGFDFVPDSKDKDLVHVKSEYKDALEEFLATLELAGIADKEDEDQLSILQWFDSIKIEDTGDEFLPFSITITKADLALYLQFEILNYMGASIAD